MIKPFTITRVAHQPDGSIDVLYTVTEVQQTGDQSTSERSCSAMITVPPGADVDNFLFDKLSEAGWF